MKLNGRVKIACWMLMYRFSVPLAFSTSARYLSSSLFPTISFSTENVQPLLMEQARALITADSGCVSDHFTYTERLVGFRVFFPICFCQFTLSPRRLSTITGHLAAAEGAANTCFISRHAKQKQHFKLLFTQSHRAARTRSADRTSCTRARTPTMFALIDRGVFLGKI